MIASIYGVSSSIYVAALLWVLINSSGSVGFSYISLRPFIQFYRNSRNSRGFRLNSPMIFLSRL